MRDANVFEVSNSSLFSLVTWFKKTFVSSPQEKHERTDDSWRTYTRRSRHEESESEQKYSKLLLKGNLFWSLSYTKRRRVKKETSISSPRDISLNLTVHLFQFQRVLFAEKQWRHKALCKLWETLHRELRLDISRAAFLLFSTLVLFKATKLEMSLFCLQVSLDDDLAWRESHLYRRLRETPMIGKGHQEENTSTYIKEHSKYWGSISWNTEYSFSPLRKQPFWFISRVTWRSKECKERQTLMRDRNIHSFCSQMTLECMTDYDIERLFDPKSSSFETLFTLLFKIKGNLCPTRRINANTTYLVHERRTQPNQEENTYTQYASKRA